MKIAVVSDYFQAEIGYAKPQVAHELKKQGHQVKIITSERYFPFHNYQQTRLQQLGPRIKAAGQRREKGLLVERLPVRWELFTRVYIKNLEKVVGEYQPELVIVFGVASPSAVRMARLKDRQSFRLLLIDSHLPSELALGNRWLKNALYVCFRAVYGTYLSKQADKVVAMQDATVDVIRDVYGLSKRAVVVDNGTDPKLFRHSSSARMRIRKEHGIRPSDFVVIYTGKVIASKGVELLAQAFSLLYQQHPRWRIWCLVVGDGPAGYRQLCQQFIVPKFQDRWLWLGTQSHRQLYRFYSAADVAVWPLQETLAMNDAAACSLPFIANNKLGAKTRVSNSNARLYKQGSSSDLAANIEYLYRHPAERRSMGKRGRALAEKKLSWGSIAQKIIE